MNSAACVRPFVADRLRAIAFAIERATFTVVAIRLSLVALLLTTSTRVTSGFGSIAEISLAFSGRVA